MPTSVCCKMVESHLKQRVQKQKNLLESVFIGDNRDECRYNPDGRIPMGA